LNLHDLATAEASARQGLVIDADHEYPELEYVLALALDDKGDRDGAVQHLKSYLALNPQGRGAAAAREQLGAWQTRGNK
jgi:tetratricopeptide (TPR) repeat protein